MDLKKIFIDCHVFDYGFQGTRTYLQGLYLELIKDKDTQFFFAACDIVNLESVFGNADNIFYLKYASKNKFYRLLIDIPRLIKKNKIDYAHFQYIVAPIKNCKYIVSTHDVLFLDLPQYFPKWNSFKNKILYRQSVKKSDIVLTGSQYSKFQIEKHFNVKDVEVTVYGVDSVFFELFDIEKVKEIINDKYGFKEYLIYVSRHEPRKNHYNLLKSFIDLSLQKNYHLVLIGDVTFRDPDFDDLLESLDSFSRSKVAIIHKVDFLSMITLLRGASLAVYPSIGEGFGLPPLESVAAKVPTICSNTTSMSEFDFFGDDFINPLDLEDLKNKISYKLSKIDIDRQNELSKLVANKYNWYIAAEQFKSVLKKDLQ
jgi:glycosyltransferase involved in cell wall biosynthesis